MKSATKIQKVVSLIILVAVVALVGFGGYGLAIRNGEQGTEVLREMRLKATLNTAGAGAVEAYVKAEKAAATAAAKEAGGGLSAIREAVAAAEVEAREKSQNMGQVDLASVDLTALEIAIGDVLAVREQYFARYEKETAAYIAEHQDEWARLAEEEAAANASADVDAQGDGEEVEVAAVKVDLSGFVPSAELTALDDAQVEYAALNDAIRSIYPELDEEILAALQPSLIGTLYVQGDTFETQFDRFVAAAGEQNMPLKNTIMRSGADMITIAIGLLLLGLCIFFYDSLVKRLGIPRLVIGIFFVFICILSVLLDLSLQALLSNTLVRMGMNSVLVLAMLPGIQCGISLNLGLPVGIIGGLIGGLLCIEWGLSGWFGFAFAIAVGIAISAVLGFLYAQLLNRLKGSEMSVTTYVGFAVVSLMCIGWLVMPFQNGALRWPMGSGLRVTISMASSYRHILNDFLTFTVMGITFPTGLFLFVGLCCYLMYMFMRSKTGIAMTAVGMNPRFAEATGISVDKMRTVGTVLSTVLGAVGIIVYAQSYGFMQLYQAPRQMGFVAASAILIGGASTSRARISHVLIGTFLFQGVLTLGMPVANALLPQSTISETLRILISNGIILYALTKSGGDSRG